MDLDRKIHTKFGPGLSLEREKGWPRTGISGAFLESGLMAKRAVP